MKHIYVSVLSMEVAYRHETSSSYKSKVQGEVVSSRSSEHVIIILIIIITIIIIIIFTVP